VKDRLAHFQLALLLAFMATRARLAMRARQRVAAREGQAFLEYALVLAVIAVIVLVAVQALGVDLSAVFNRIRARLSSLG